MLTTTIRRKAERVLKELPTQKLEIAVTFLEFLRERHEAEEQMRLQLSSNAYNNWVSDKDDIYDEVFGKLKE